LQVRAIGPRIQVEHDGIEALDVNLDNVTIPAQVKRQSSGRIGLQSHPIPGVQFRNIVIRDLTSATTTIPAGAEPFGNQSYKFFGEQLEWKAARAKCESLGGNLVIIDSAEESKFVADLVAAAAWQDAWIGITDEAQEGTWTTVTGQPLAFTNWFPGQPNNKGEGEHFALISNRSAGVESIAWRWSDQPNQARSLHQPGFVCEWKLPPTEDSPLGSAIEPLKKE
jgi:hypothetical protein